MAHTVHNEVTITTLSHQPKLSDCLVAVADLITVLAEEILVGLQDGEIQLGHRGGRNIRVPEARILSLL